MFLVSQFFLLFWQGLLENSKPAKNAKISKFSNLKIGVKFSVFQNEVEETI